MSKLERITVSMPEEMAAKIRAAVDCGEYATTSEIVREALRDWTASQDRREASLAAFRAEIDKGLEGPFLPAEEVFEDLRAFVRERVAFYKSEER